MPKQCPKCKDDSFGSAVELIHHVRICGDRVAGADFKQLFNSPLFSVPSLFESCVLHDVGMGSRRFDDSSARLLQLLWVPTLSAEAFLRSQGTPPFTADETKYMAERISSTLTGLGWTPQSEPNALVASLITRVRVGGLSGLVNHCPGAVPITEPPAAVFASCHNPGCGMWVPRESLVRVSDASLCPQCFVCFVHGASLQQVAGSSYTGAWLQLEASMPESLNFEAVKSLCHTSELRRALSLAVGTSMLALCPNFGKHTGGPCVTALPVQQDGAVSCDACGTSRCPHCLLPHHPEALGSTAIQRCAAAMEAECTDVRFDTLASKHVDRDSATMQKILSAHRQVTDVTDSMGRFQDIRAALAAVTNDLKSAESGPRMLSAENFASCPHCGFSPLEVGAGEIGIVCGWSARDTEKPAAGCGRVVQRSDIRHAVALRDPAQQLLDAWRQRLQLQVEVLRLLGDSALPAAAPKLDELVKPVSQEFACSECSGKLIGHFYLSCVSCVHHLCARCVSKGKSENHRSQRALHALHVMTAESRE